MPTDPYSTYLSLFAHGRTDIIGRPKAWCVQLNGSSTVTDAILDHLNGRERVGVYPLDREGKCRWGVVEFEAHGDGAVPDPLTRAQEFTQQLQNIGLWAYVERSKGDEENYHVWTFFSEPISASLVRGILRKMTEQLGYPSVELFPKRETVIGPAPGGFVFLPYFAGIDGEGSGVADDRTVMLDWHGHAMTLEAFSHEVRTNGAEDVKHVADMLGIKEQPARIFPETADETGGERADPPSTAWSQLIEKCTQLVDLAEEQKEKGLGYWTWLHLGQLASRGGQDGRAWFIQLTEKYGPGCSQKDLAKAKKWITGDLKGMTTCAELGCNPDHCGFLPYRHEVTGDPIDPSPVRWLTIQATTSASKASKGAKPDDPDENPEEETDPFNVTPWPDAPDAAAFYGLAGDLARAVDPYTEADPTAILVQALVGFGNLVGRGPHFVAEGSRHYTNLFAVLVGATAKGRKGSAWAHVANILTEIDEEWARKRKLSGLSSGEGLIWEVRDAIHKRELVRKKGEPPIYEDVEADPGVSDKRLLCFEGEFASPLKAMCRQGNTLSTAIRQAWDDGNLNTMVKNSPARATGGHISIVGHITRNELLKDLAETETSNGFANRFLWLCVRRSKCLPEGNDAQNLDLRDLIRRFQEAADFAGHVQQMRRDDFAHDLWHSVYANLSEGKPGMFGVVTSRSEAQVMRLACTYAVLDKSALVKLPHLEAALALWRYCAASCRWIFGDSLGDETADRILEALRSSEKGMARNDFREMLGRHKSRAEMTRALRVLVQNGLARREKVETGGRPTEWWTAIGIHGSKGT